MGYRIIHGNGDLIGDAAQTAADGFVEGQRARSEREHRAAQLELWEQREKRDQEVFELGKREAEQAIQMAGAQAQAQIANFDALDPNPQVGPPDPATEAISNRLRSAQRFAQETWPDNQRAQGRFLEDAGESVKKDIADSEGEQALSTLQDQLARSATAGSPLAEQLKPYAEGWMQILEAAKGLPAAEQINALQEVTRQRGQVNQALAKQSVEQQKLLRGVAMLEQIKGATDPNDTEKLARLDLIQATIELGGLKGDDLADALLHATHGLVKTKSGVYEREGDIKAREQETQALGMEKMRAEILRLQSQTDVNKSRAGAAPVNRQGLVDAQTRAAEALAKQRDETPRGPKPTAEKPKFTESHVLELSKQIQAANKKLSPIQARNIALGILSGQVDEPVKKPKTKAKSDSPLLDSLIGG